MKQPIAILGYVVVLIVMSTVTGKRVYAQWSHNPSFNNAISKATNNQTLPTITSDGSGGAIIAWQDFRSGTNSDIYAQRINSTGVVQWTAGGVAISTAASDQLYPAIVSDGSGGAIIAWQDIRGGTNSDIYAQRINSSGVVQWTADGVAISTAANDQLYPAIVSDGSVGAIIAWRDFRGGTSSDIYAQRINASGVVQWTADGVAISTAANDQTSPNIVSDGSGGAIIAWEDRRGSNPDIYAQRINSSGVVQWTADGVAISTAANDQLSPTIVSDGAGGAIITWEDHRGGLNSDIYAQRINSSGVVQWTADGVAISTAANDQLSPTIVSDGAGGAIITWEDYRGGTFSDVYAQRINSSGVVQWTAGGVAISTATKNQTSPNIVSDGSGGAIITWEDYRGGIYSDIYAQLVYNDGTLGGPPSSATIHLRFPLQDQFPYDAPISSVLDHFNCPFPGSKTNPFVDFLNERGGETKKEWKRNAKYDVFYALKNGKSASYLPNYNYRYANTLWYMGSAGYDYPVPYGTNVYAVAPGKVTYPSYIGYSIPPSIKNARDIATLEIDHRPTPGSGTGYVSYYMNLSTHPDHTKLGIDDAIAHEGDIVTAGDLIAKSGSIYKKKGVTKPQLHYELHWINALGKHIIVDPYGWNPADGTPDPLYTNFFNNGGDARPASDKGKWLWAALEPRIPPIATSSGKTGPFQPSAPLQSTISSWVRVSSSTTEPLLAVDFPSASIGYAVGVNGTILKTTNGGTQWQLFLNAPSTDYTGTHFTSATDGIVVGTNTILHTTDGGNSWSQRWLIPSQAFLFDTVNSSAFLQHVFFASDNVGYISGGYLDSQRVTPVFLKTTDAGNSWTSIADYFAAGIYDERYVQASHFQNDSIGFVLLYSVLYPQSDSDAVIDSAKVLKTTDGGSTWFEGTQAQLSDYASEIIFVSPDTGYSVGSGTLFKTTDGTSSLPTWTGDSTIPGSVQSLCKTNEGLIGVGLTGNVILSPDGSSWSVETNGTSSDLFSVSSRNGVVCAVGDGGTILLRQILATSALPVVHGWNMISNPLIVSNNAKSFLFPTASSKAFSYHGSYFIVDSLKNGIGYWLKFPSDQVVDISGVPTTAETVAVFHGWNMVGSVNMPLATDSITSSPPNLVTSKFFGYSGSSYFMTDSIRPGKSYWVKVNQDGQLVLSASSTAAPSNRIRIVQTEELPPPPPDGRVTNLGPQIPKEFGLEQNYPNPFNPVTTVKYDLPQATHVNLKIYNVLGQLVATLVDGMQDAGYKTVSFDASGQPSGVYFYRITAGSHSEVRTMLLLK